MGLIVIPDCQRWHRRSLLESNAIVTTIDSITAETYNHRCNGCVTTIKGGIAMERIMSQMRWPVEVYKAVKERAYRERKSFNAMVVELVVKALG